MIVNLPYQNFVKLLPEWISSEGLGLTQQLSMPEAKSTNGVTQVWEAGNYLLLVSNEEPDKTRIEWRPIKKEEQPNAQANRAWDKLSQLVDELNKWREPIIIGWRVSELRKWVDDYKDDTGLQVGCYLPPDGTIQINQEVDGPEHLIISLDGKRLSSGQIAITPTYSSHPFFYRKMVTEIKRWRSALKNAIEEKATAFNEKVPGGTSVPRVPELQPSESVKGYQIKLLYLIYYHAGGIGDSSYPIGLKDICTVDDSYALWFIAAEDLAHEGWIKLQGTRLDNAVVSMTPAGRKQAREWEQEYSLESRLIVNESGTWISDIGMSSISIRGKDFNGNLWTKSIVFDGTFKETLRYIKRQVGGKYGIYISDLDVTKERAIILLSSEAQRAVNDQLASKWLPETPKNMREFSTVGHIVVSPMTKRKTEVNIIAFSEDCNQCTESLRERMVIDGVASDIWLAPAAAIQQPNSTQAGKFASVMWPGDSDYDEALWGTAIQRCR